MTCAQRLLRLLWGGGPEVGVLRDCLLNSGIGAEFFMTCTIGIGMLYSDISLFTYVQIVVYFLNAAFRFYTSKVI